MGSAQVFILGKKFHTLVTQKIAKYLEKCTKLLKPQKTRKKKFMVVPITHIGVWRLARNATLNTYILGTFF